MPSPVDLTSFKNYLNVTANTTFGGDVELQLFLDTATAMVDYEVGGNIEPQDRTENHHGGRPTITLMHPVIAVTSVTETLGSMRWTITEQNLSGDPSTWSIYGYSLDGQVLTRRVNGYAGRWQPGRYNILVTYTSGLTVIPASVQIAIYELALHLFRSQQGSRNPMNEQSDWTPDRAYAMPNRVRELLEPVRRLPGIG